MTHNAQQTDEPASDLTESETKQPATTPLPADPAEAKAEMRKQAAARRKQAAEDNPEAASQLALHTEALIAEGAPLLVAGYWPIRSEIDPRPLMQALQAAGCHLCLPVTPEPGKPLIFHEWDGHPDCLVDGPYGTSQPDPTLPSCLPDLVLAPLLAFDGRGYRLGYGGGFYDRTLAAFDAAGHKARLYGLAYAEQATQSVPTGPYDRPLQGILTPSGLQLATSEI